MPRSPMPQPVLPAAAAPLSAARGQLCCAASPGSRSNPNPRDPGLTSGDGRIPARARGSPCLDSVCEQAREGMTKRLRVWTLGEESLGSFSLG